MHITASVFINDKVDCIEISKYGLRACSPWAHK
jgi:hypothetical protein